MRVVVGHVGRAHGIKGDVIVELRTDEPGERFSDGSSLFTEPESAGPLEVAHSRFHSGRFLVRFVESADRNTAERLRGVTLLAEVNPLDQPSDPDEFYDHQIVGLAVVDAKHGSVGSVTEVNHGPGQDLLVVATEQGQEVLIPFVAAFVTEIDLPGGRLLVDLPDGLIELGEA